MLPEHASHEVMGNTELSPLVGEPGLSHPHCVSTLKKIFIYLFRAALSLLLWSISYIFVLHKPSYPMAHGIFPDLGIEPMSSASAGRLPTTGPPGKSLGYI